MSFASKIIKFFYPPGSKDKMKYLEYFHQINVMLQWTRTEQIGFCFYLFDTNDDGLICIRDMFQLMGQLRDDDQVVRVDIQKLINIIQQKSNHLRRTRFISPVTYGISYKQDAVADSNEYESSVAKRKANRILRHFDTSLVTCELLAEQNVLILDKMINKNGKGKQKGQAPDAHVPMVWDKILNKLVQVKADSFAADVQTQFFHLEEDTSEATDGESDLDLKVLNLRKKIIKRRNQDKQNTYQQYLVKKADKINHKLKYTDIKQSEIN